MYIMCFYAALLVIVLCTLCTVHSKGHGNVTQVELGHDSTFHVLSIVFCQCCYTIKRRKNQFLESENLQIFCKTRS